ncbi:UNVERIFIED_CONTAM: profilin, required for normal timing of actin polymerization in response to thermal stress [Siphonaria sp. JEL0065]|nr:profilin, required for normal timing of actin polymerization in response to thermal stress [Siphonaria sp. JEL0065]
MSWQGYVDNQLLGTQKIQKAAIYGHDGAVWAASAGFALSPAEATALIGAYKDASGIRGNGLYAAGIKYFTLRADDRSIYGKQGAGGIICVKTKMAVLIGVYADPVQPGEATKVVEALADYLISVNYVSFVSCISLFCG